MATAGDIIARARTVLNDSAGDRWSDTDLIADINAAIKQILVVRPDANPVTDVITLQPGTRQSIPGDGLRLMDVIRNMGQDGATPGLPVTGVSRSILEALNRSWHRATGKTEIRHFVFDEKAPTDFYVYPPAHATTPVTVEILYSAMPAELVADTDVIPLAAVYEGPIEQWVLHMAFSRDIASRTSQALAGRYEAAFYRSLGVKLKGDLMVSPNDKPEIKIV